MRTASIESSSKSTQPQPARETGRYAFGSMRFEPSSGELWHPGEAEPLQLRPQVARLLEVLLKGHGHVVSREALYESIWGETFVDQEQGLNFLIRQLRIALRDDAREPRLVETVRGRGYRFLEPVEQGAEAADSVRERRSLRQGRRLRRRAWVLATVGLGLALLALARPTVRTALDGRMDGPEPASEAVRQAYLDARYLETKRTVADQRRAAARYQQAISLDPGYAPAWVGLASVHQSLVQGGAEPAREGLQMARDAAAAALERDPGSAKAHMILGTAELYLHLDWDRASRHLATATAVDPSSAEIRLWHARALAAAGRFDKAIGAAQTALDLDPESRSVLVDLGWFYYFAERYAQAVRVSRRVLELEPESFAALQCLQLSLLAVGEEEGARDATERIATIISGEGLARLADGGRGWIVELADQMAAGCDSLALERARLLALGGRRTEALEALRDGLDRRLWWSPFVAVDPGFASLRKDVRFEHMLEEVRRGAA